MAIDVQRTMDFGGVRKIINLPDGVNPQDAATVAQLNAGMEGLAWKDSCRVSTQANITIASPGATIDGITMVTNDRVLVRAQTTGAENGIYIWNGAAIPMTRSLDCSTGVEIKQAITTVEEGTNAGVSYRQSVVNVTLGTTSLTWGVFGAGVGPASESSSGTAEIATQAETDAGADDGRMVTPLKLGTSVFASKKYAVNVGDGSATSIDVTHNLGTRDVDVTIYRNSGNYDDVLVEVQRTSVNVVRLLFDTAPAANAYRVKVST